MAELRDLFENLMTLPEMKGKEFENTNNTESGSFSLDDERALLSYIGQYVLVMGGGKFILNSVGLGNKTDNEGQGGKLVGQREIVISEAIINDKRELVVYTELESQQSHMKDRFGNSWLYEKRTKIEMFPVEEMPGMFAAREEEIEERLYLDGFENFKTSEAIRPEFRANLPHVWVTKNEGRIVDFGVSDYLEINGWAGLTRMSFGPDMNHKASLIDVVHKHKDRDIKLDLDHLDRCLTAREIKTTLGKKTKSVNIRKFGFDVGAKVNLPLLLLQYAETKAVPDTILLKGVSYRKELEEVSVWPAKVFIEGKWQKGKVYNQNAVSPHLFKMRVYERDLNVLHTDDRCGRLEQLSIQSLKGEYFVGEVKNGMRRVVGFSADGMPESSEWVSSDKPVTLGELLRN
jgi:hypothetical protein